MHSKKEKSEIHLMSQGTTTRMRGQIGIRVWKFDVRVGAGLDAVLDGEKNGTGSYREGVQ